MADPFLPASRDVSTLLAATRPLFSSFLRIRALHPSSSSSSSTNPEYLAARADLIANVQTLEADLDDLEASVQAVEQDPARFGLGAAEVGRRRTVVRDAAGEVGSMRRELDSDGDPTFFQTETAPPAGGYHQTANGAGAEHDDPYGAFEAETQQQMLHEQDEQLDDVFGTVGRLRGQATTMGRELEEQAGILADVDALADRVGGKLQGGLRRVGEVVRRNEDTMSSCCIAVLIFVLILLLILVITL